MAIDRLGVLLGDDRDEHACLRHSGQGHSEADRAEPRSGVQRPPREDS